ncbi:MAG TPA: urea carboxylase-associated family protein, partial [Acidimicrobiales bacterium]|nr:urea carboxylase-associated family protein [Acidimicrobiales bacterium]
MAGLAPGVERYRVTGGAVTAVLLGAGDRLQIIDPEGCQPVEVAAFDRDGNSDPGLLGDLPHGASGAPATGITAILAAKGIDLATATAVQLFAPDSPSGLEAWLTATADVVCVIGVTGGKMLPHEQNPPTDIIAFVHRTAPPVPGLEVLPTPLADQNQDLRIDAATARVYEVKAGEFIQVIDVEGRECSDFQCFDAARLDGGVEAALDATITRSLMGASYPMPGLFAKYYSLDFQPMVEVVHDTVGRHDTFNTACNPKYYEDMGYPGHVNCSENFNRVLAPYDIAPRRGWEAI